MVSEDYIRQIAIDEVTAQTFELTKQILNVNKVMIADGKPHVEDVIIDEGEDEAAVYFPIEGESYYFVVYIDTLDSPSLRWVGTSAGNSVEFAVSSSDKPLPELLAMVDFVPSTQWEKGEPGYRSIPRKHSGFAYNPYPKRTGEVEGKLQAIVEFLTPYREQVVKLTENAEAGISIAYYGYKEQMYGIHLSEELMGAIAGLNLSIDIDLYAGGPDLARKA